MAAFCSYTVSMHAVMAGVYDVELTVLTRLLDQLIPSRQVVRRPRHSDPWFDGECRHAKRLGRRLERRYAAVCRRAADDAEVNAVKTAWYDQRRAYRGHCTMMPLSTATSVHISRRHPDPTKTSVFHFG